MTQDDWISRALLDPAAEFETPNDILASSSMTREQKIEVLRRWEYDASELSVADDEGMPPGKSVSVAEVLEALHQLVPKIDTERRPPTKQGGIDQASLRKEPPKTAK